MFLSFIKTLNLKLQTMKRKSLFAVCTLFAAAAFTFTSCQNAEEPLNTEPIDQSAPETRAATIDNFARVVYVEVNDVNPLNAGEYMLSNGTPFFTHVILFASNIRGDASGNAFNYNNPNNAAILADPAKYIAPLRAKGIKVLMGNLCDHTGLGFANVTQAQANDYTDDLLAYAGIVDGYDFDDEWADYGQHGYPWNNNTSFSLLINTLRSKTDKLITVFDYNGASTLDATAAANVNMAYYAILNGYGSPSFGIPMSRYCPYLCDLTKNPTTAIVKARTAQAMNANAAGICFFNLPESPTNPLPRLNAAAQAFNLTCTHSGITYGKDYGN